MRTLVILSLVALPTVTVVAGTIVRGWWIDRRAAALHEGGAR